MIVRFTIYTARKCASFVGDSAKRWIIGAKKVKLKQWVNEDDDVLCWEIEGSVRDILAINKNVALFKPIVDTILKNKLVGLAVKPEQKEELRKLLEKDTKIETVLYDSVKDYVKKEEGWWSKFIKKLKN